MDAAAQNVTAAAAAAVLGQTNAASVVPFSSAAASVPQSTTTLIGQRIMENQRPSNGLLRPVAAELLAQLMQASSAGPQPQHPFAGAPSSQAPFSAIAQNAQAQQQTISAQVSAAAAMAAAHFGETTVSDYVSNQQSINHQAAAYAAASAVSSYNLLANIGMSVVYNNNNTMANVMNHAGSGGAPTPSHPYALIASPPIAAANLCTDSNPHSCLMHPSHQQNAQTRFGRNSIQQMQSSQMASPNNAFGSSSQNQRNLAPFHSSANLQQLHSSQNHHFLNETSAPPSPMNQINITSRSSGRALKRSLPSSNTPSNQVHLSQAAAASAANAAATHSEDIAAVNQATALLLDAAAADESAQQRTTTTTATATTIVQLQQQQTLQPSAAAVLPLSESNRSFASQMVATAAAASAAAMLQAPTVARQQTSINENSTSLMVGVRDPEQNSQTTTTLLGPARIATTSMEEFLAAMTAAASVHGMASPQAIRPAAYASAIQPTPSPDVLLWPRLLQLLHVAITIIVTITIILRYVTGVMLRPMRLRASQIR
ncbi:hypothetical protein DdX_10414 [Ditylenchus destructor]|uniref:Uncharacterized protein n=1 Tax=Ditylenchus destructor TaxID=166010 RepID=A0AAD4R5C1_9BILA|nr:hypothetical protein DdX_10414 [Ditylenchus destructor]